MKLLTLISVLLSLKAGATVFQPEGIFSCPITIEEHVDLVLEEGEDFPTFRGRFDPPIIRKESLKLEFSTGEMPKAKILNPEILPNFLFVTPKYYNNFSSFSWTTDEENKKEIVYQIDYPSWYFGATVSITTVEVKKNSKKMKVDIRFDDNDGWWTTLRFVKCSKI